MQPQLLSMLLLIRVITNSFNMLLKQLKMKPQPCTLNMILLGKTDNFSKTACMIQKV